MALAGQLHVPAVMSANDGLVIEPIRVCQIYHEPDLDLVGLHRAEKHVRVEAVLGRDLVIISLIQRGFEREESASHK